MIGYYDRQGRPIPDEQAFALMGDDTARRVDRTRVGDYDVSTVHLVIDHNHSGIGAPALFETMVFKGESNMDEYCARYTTEDDARRGHDNIVGMIRALEDIEGA